MTRQHTLDEYEAAIAGTGGVVSEVARKLGVRRQSAHERIKKSDRLQEAIDNERNSTLDLCETGLIAAITAGDLAAIRFYLLTQGKRRGYTYKTEIDANVETSAKVVFYLPEKTPVDDVPAIPDGNAPEATNSDPK